MTLDMANHYDAYAYFILCFLCDDCGASIEPTREFTDCDDEYCFDIARQAESAGWFASLGGTSPCLCPACRKKRDL
jgi:hypothetical protein